MCIRDRYQRRVHGEVCQNNTKSMIKGKTALLLVCLVATSSIASQIIYQDTVNGYFANVDGAGFYRNINPTIINVTNSNFADNVNGNFVNIENSQFWDTKGGNFQNLNNVSVTGGTNLHIKNANIIYLNGIENVTAENVNHVFGFNNKGITLNQFTDAKQTQSSPATYIQGDGLKIEYGQYLSLIHI
eukprot:TRINITY_DN2034_c0_g1_i18.p1 TRINITY_DN2034_c0_g1~~TRINITY_DN2034_c0_g1_i18.p1  ORF type:complete len:187 (-),score=43.64 TRINITY_DN2034_c0_g1_i18:64-624(-)